MMKKWCANNMVLSIMIVLHFLMVMHAQKWVPHYFVRKMGAFLGGGL